MTVEVKKVEEFLTRVKEAFKSYEGSGELKTEIQEVIQEIEDHKLEITNPVPTILPVYAHLEEAYGQATQKEPISSIIDSLKQLMPNLVWEHGYRESEMSREFGDNFGIADVIGPHGLIYSTDFRLGVVLMGPGTWYPPHAHPSSELYYILSGEAEWRIGDTKKIQKTGSMIFHPGNEPHAMLTGKTPLLAMYTWRGDVQEGSKFL